MDRTLSMVFVLSAGLAQPVQALLNSHLAKSGATTVWAACISAAVTAVTLALVAVVALRVAAPSPRLIVSMPIVAITGGAIGALVLGSITAVTPRLGATVTYLCFVAGITVSSVLLDQFGILDLPQQSLTLWRAVGIALILSGVAVVRLM